MTAVPEPTVQPTVYEVSCLPADHSGRHHFTITVEHRGADRWAVMDGRMCLGADRHWEFEMQPSSRTDEWLTQYRFPLDEALALAKDAAKEMTVNGHTVEWALTHD